MVRKEAEEHLNRLMESERKNFVWAVNEEVFEMEFNISS